ncbi:MAG: transglutaminase-like domain-containing protein, partial [Thermoguttaceae bacterium]
TTAADVAARREGDCKAHALYLAALARARGIPARVAVGLVYLAPKQAMAYHMWTEVYIDNRWIPIDGTLAKGGIGAGHLTLGHSNMAGIAAYASFLPVIQVLGELQVELLDAK